MEELSPTNEPLPASATVEATDFDFIDQTDYVDSAGDAVIVGLIKYTGSTTIGSLDLAVDLEDTDHNVLVSKKADILPALVKPGGLIPFKAVFSDPPASFDYYNTSVQGDDANAANVADFATDFEVVQYDLVSGTAGTATKIRGIVRNNGSTTSHDTVVIAALFDQSDAILDVSSGSVSLSSLGPAEQSRFEISFENGDGGGTFELVATGNTK